MCVRVRRQVVKAGSLRFSSGYEPCQHTPLLAEPYCQPITLILNFPGLKRLWYLIRLGNFHPPFACTQLSTHDQIQMATIIKLIGTDFTATLMRISKEDCLVYFYKACLSLVFFCGCLLLELLSDMHQSVCKSVFQSPY